MIQMINTTFPNIKRPNNMSCNHDNDIRTEITHLCNIMHRNNDHQECHEQCYKYDRTDCPHVFGVQKCECGKEFIGALGDYHKDTTENLREGK